MVGTGDLDPNPANTIPLRRDIHRCFDQRWFAIVPKPYQSQKAPQFVTHILTTKAADLWPDYHYIHGLGGGRTT